MLGGCWYIAFPLSQYNEDVKAIAQERGLTIVDKVHQGGNLQMANAPVLTFKEKQVTKK